MNFGVKLPLEKIYRAVYKVNDDKLAERSQFIIIKIGNMKQKIQKFNQFQRRNEKKKRKKPKCAINAYLIFIHNFKIYLIPED